jgi:hypothetical protein
MVPMTSPLLNYVRQRQLFWTFLIPALQTCMPRLADIFNSASAIGLRLAFLMQTKRIFISASLLRIAV